MSAQALEEPLQSMFEKISSRSLSMVCTIGSSLGANPTTPLRAIAVNQRDPGLGQHVPGQLPVRRQEPGSRSALPGFDQSCLQSTWSTFAGGIHKRPPIAKFGNIPVFALGQLAWIEDAIDIAAVHEPDQPFR